MIKVSSFKLVGTGLQARLMKNMHVICTIFKSYFVDEITKLRVEGLQILCDLRLFFFYRIFILAWKKYGRKIRAVIQNQSFTIFLLFFNVLTARANK